MWIVLKTGNSPPPSSFLAPAGAPSCTICVLKDSCVLDEGHVPCMLHKAPVTQEGRLAVRKTVLLQGQARRLPLCHSCHRVPEGPAVAVVSLLAATHALVAALLVSHAERAQRGRVVLRVVDRHAAGIEELAHRWGRMERMAREERGGRIVALPPSSHRPALPQGWGGHNLTHEQVSPCLFPRPPSHPHCSV